MREEEKTMCFIMRGPCTEGACAIWQVISAYGKYCPIGMEKESLEAIAQALKAAGTYADEIFGIDRADERDLLDKLVESIRTGKVDLARLVKDALSLD